MRYICLSASCGCKWERQGLNLAKRSQDKAKSHFQSQSLDLFKCKQLSLNRSLMSRAGVNQKHEADVCLHLQGGLAVSRLPWQAGFGRCQNLELWRDSMNLPVRPGLPPAISKSREGKKARHTTGHRATIQPWRMHSTRFPAGDSGHHLCGPCDQCGFAPATANTAANEPLFSVLNTLGCGETGSECRLQGSALDRHRDEHACLEGP